MNAIQPFLDHQGFVVLDGALATQLEDNGAQLLDALWSAALLIDDPGAIRAVHLANLAAGADCIGSASYQATVEGFARRGFEREEAERLLVSSVELALDARDAFWATEGQRGGRLRPIVAASIGPWGASQADGSEYTGAYALDEAGLLAFHRPRWRLLAGTGAEIFACETIPSAAEGRALARLLGETPDIQAWFSFCCRDERHLSDGTLLRESALALADIDQVAAIGVNCTAPRFVPSLIDELRAVTDKPIVAYPNSGESYDAQAKTWSGDRTPGEFRGASREWWRHGARLIGGCCRTGPEHVRAIRAALEEASH